MGNSAGSASSVAKRPRRRPGENRERLIEAGIEQFGVSGYHAASTAAIGALAHVPQPHVYANFETKHDLFMRCLEVACARLLEGGEVGQTPEQLDLAARMLFQAVALAGAVPADDGLIRLLRETRGRLGERRFTSLLGRAAMTLL